MPKQGGQGKGKPKLGDRDMGRALIKQRVKDSTAAASLRKGKPIMSSILDNNHAFDIEYGSEDLYDSVRDYLIDNDFITHIDELEED